jgi:hypothetical protein
LAGITEMVNLTAHGLASMRQLLSLQKDLRISFGLKLFTSVLIVLIPGFFFGALSLSFALLFGLFAWLIAAPPVSKPKRYFKTALATVMTFFAGGVVFNLLNPEWAKLLFVISFSSLAVYIAINLRSQSAGFGIVFMATCYMAVKNYPESGIWYWPSIMTLGTIFYAAYSFLWDLFFLPAQFTTVPPQGADNAVMQAFRLAVSLSLTTIAANILGLDYMSWALMTVGLVISDDITRTFHRAKERAIGTLLGCMYALIMFRFSLHTLYWLLILSMLLPLAYAVAHRWYLFSVSIYTLNIAFLYHYAGVAGEQVVFYRGLDTVTGAFLAVLSVFLTDKVTALIKEK